MKALGERWRVREREGSSSDDSDSTTSSSRSPSREKDEYPSPPQLSPVTSISSPHSAAPPDLVGALVDNSSAAGEEAAVETSAEHTEEMETVTVSVPERKSEEKESTSKHTSKNTKDKRSQSRDRKRSHRSRSRSKHRHSGSSKSKKRRSSSRDRKRHSSRDRHRHRDKKSRHSNRDRKRSRSKSQDRKRSKSRDRKRSKSRDRKHRSRSRSKGRDRKDRKRSKSRDRKRDRSKDRKGRDKKSSRRKRSKSRERSRERLRSRSPMKNKKLTFKEQMRKDLLTSGKEAAENKAINLPKTAEILKELRAAGKAVTPQMALLQTMAAMHQKAQEITGVAVPKYYNPAAVNPLKYAEQVQKRKLLWSKKGDEKEKEKDDQIESQWKSMSLLAAQDGKAASKFRKLMGIHEDDEAAEEIDPEQLNEEQVQKHAEIFDRLDKEYEFARMATHTHRGIGLGFASQTYNPNFPTAPPSNNPPP